MKPGGTSLKCQPFGNPRPENHQLKGSRGCRVKSWAARQLVSKWKLVKKAGGLYLWIKRLLSTRITLSSNLCLDKKKILNSLMIGGVGTKIENEMLYNILNRATLFRKVWILCLNMNTIQDSCTLLLSVKMSTTSLRVSLTTLTKPMLWIYITLKLN